MNWIKCVPFVGTTVSACECLSAVYHGEGKTALWKFGETLVDGAMDVATVATGGLAAVASAPGKMAAKGAGKVAVSTAIKAVAGRAFLGAVADTVANSNLTSTSSSGNQQNNNDDDEQNNKQDKQDDGASGPILDYKLGPAGRVENLTACIRPCHLREGQRSGRRYTEAVRKFVRSLDPCAFESGQDEDDQVGHIVGDILGGPPDQLYNFFPQAPYSNRDMYQAIERKIFEFLRAEKAAGRNYAWVKVHYEFQYGDQDYPNRPRWIIITWEFSDGSGKKRTTIRNV